MRKNSQYISTFNKCKYLIRKIKKSVSPFEKQLFINALNIKLSRLPRAYLLSFSISLGLWGQANIINAQTIPDFSISKNLQLFWADNVEFLYNSFVDIDSDGDKDFFIMTSIFHYNRENEDYIQFNENIGDNGNIVFRPYVGSSSSEELLSFLNIKGLNNVLLFFALTSQKIKFGGFMFKDFNGDSKEDIYLCTDKGAYIYTRKNRDDIFEINTTPYLYYKYAHDFNDIDGDGLPDILTQDDSGHFYYIKNIGNQPMAQFNMTDSIFLPNLIFHRLIDYDHDGDLDGIYEDATFIWDSNHDDYHYILLKSENIGTSTSPQFSEKIDTLFILRNSNLPFTDHPSGDNFMTSDIDSDGDFDLLFTKPISFSCSYCNVIHSVMWKENKDNNFVLEGVVKTQNNYIFDDILLNVRNNDINSIVYGGNFSIHLPVGEDTIAPILPDGWVSQPPFIALTVSEGEDSIHKQDFIISNPPGSEDYTVDINGSRIRLGEHSNQQITVENISDSVANLIIKWKPDSRLEFLSSDITYDSINNGVYYFSKRLAALQKHSFRTYLNVPNSLTLGDTLMSEVIILPQEDKKSLNNFSKILQVVKGSYDPNDKSVFPEGIGEEKLTDENQKRFTYTVRFQNIGNDDADNIKVIDTLDNDFNLSTIKIIASSPPYSYVFIDSNVLKIYFFGINLVPKSEDETLSQGFVKYSIEVRDDAHAGTLLTNTANIYFDNNPPITTNTTTNLLALLSKIQQQSTPNLISNAYPNPAKDRIFIEWDKKQVGKMVLTVYNSNGKLIDRQTVQNGMALLQTINYEKGLYIYTLEDINKTGFGKFVVE